MPASSDFVAAVKAQVLSLGIEADAERINALAEDLGGRERFAFAAQWGSPGLIAYDAEDIRKALEIEFAEERAPESAAPKASSLSEAQQICAAFDLDAAAWRAMPPSDKLRLRSELAGKVAADAAEKNATDLLAEKVQSGKATPSEKLEFARRTGATGPTRAQKRDPMWRRAQEETASVEQLRNLVRGHEQIYCSAAYPEVLRADHRAQAERLRNIIKQREEA